MLTLILGGARSGKSALAENLAESATTAPVYLATSEARDGEMSERIQEHRSRRGPHWSTIEEPLDLAGVLGAQRADAVILLDCLTLWLSNMFEGTTDIRDATDRWLDAIGPAQHVIAVSNEIGLGLVPETPLGRRFRDAQGRLNQQVAARADRVLFVAAGLPMVLKGDPL